MTGEYRIVIKNGKAEMIYSDDLKPLMDRLGAATVKRVSHVEPHPTKPGWVADMRPVDGPVLCVNGVGRFRADVDPTVLAADGARNAARVADLASIPLSVFFDMGDYEELEPFATRQAALDAELEWLREHRGL